MNHIQRIIVCGVILALLICASGCRSVVMMLKGETEEAVKALETGLGYSEYGVLYYTYLVALTELEDTEKIEKVNGVLEEAGIEAPERIQKYIDGKLTLKQLFMEGTGDIE